MEIVGVCRLSKTFTGTNLRDRAAGPDAMLLITETLKPGELMDFMIAVAELTLTVFVGVHRADSLLAVRSVIGFRKKRL